MSHRTTMNLFLSHNLHKNKNNSCTFTFLISIFHQFFIRYLNEVDEVAVVVAVNEEGVDYVDYKYQVDGLEELRENIGHASLEERLLNFLGITNEDVVHATDDQTIGGQYEEVNLVGMTEEGYGTQVSGQNRDDHLDYLGHLLSLYHIHLHIEVVSFASPFVFDYKTKHAQPPFLYLNCQLNWQFPGMQVFDF